MRFRFQVARDQRFVAAIVILTLMIPGSAAILVFALHRRSNLVYESALAPAYEAPPVSTARGTTATPLMLAAESCLTDQVRQAEMVKGDSI